MANAKSSEERIPSYDFRPRKKKYTPQMVKHGINTVSSPKFRPIFQAQGDTLAESKVNATPKGGRKTPATKTKPRRVMSVITADKARRETTLGPKSFTQMAVR